MVSGATMKRNHSCQILLAMSITGSLCEGLNKARPKGMYKLRQSHCLVRQECLRKQATNTPVQSRILSSSSQQLQSPQHQPQPQLQQLTQGGSPLSHPSQAQHSQHNLQHASSQQHQQQQPHPSLAATTSSLSNHSDVDMQNADSNSLSDVSNTPITMQADEPGYTRKKIKDFLCTHSIYELIPESGKVVLLDIELPVRQAFHALHEQGVAAASLWDAQAAQVAGIISASDFIHILRRLRSSVSSGANPASEEEMDQHTIRGQLPSSSGSTITGTTKQLCLCKPCICKPSHGVV